MTPIQFQILRGLHETVKSTIAYAMENNRNVRNMASLAGRAYADGVEAFFDSDAAKVQFPDEPKPIVPVQRLEGETA